jgi:hypothetical protein
VLSSAVKVPGPFRLIHGETATLFDVLLVYVVGLVFGLLALTFASTRVETLPIWKAALLFVIAADISGGATASFTVGTDAFYGSRPGLRWGFIFFHLLQPGLLFLLFGGKIVYWIFLCAFTIAAASMVNIMRGRARQQAAATALLLIGIVILLPIWLSIQFLAWFGPVYMLKLILGFAVCRTASE